MEIIKSGTKIDFLGKTKIALTGSAIVIAAIWLLVPFRVNLGVDFAGGSEIEVKFATATTAESVRGKIEAAGFGDASVQQYGSEADNSFLVRVDRINIVPPERAVAVKESVTQKLVAYGIQSVAVAPNVGDRIDVRSEKPIPPAELRAAVEAAGVEVTTKGEAVRDLTRAGLPAYQVLTRSLSEKVTAALVQSSGEGQVDVRRVEFVGPQVGAQLRNKGIMAVLLSMLAILIYVAFRFQPAYAPGGVIALFHDISIVMGFYVVTGAEFNLTSIAVLLTIIGYSINDTIVIFDRVREVLGRKNPPPLKDAINLALNETLSRTILTASVTAVSLIGLIVFGVGTIQDFAIAMLVGLVSGTYSTIYVASPIAVFVSAQLDKREAEQARRAKAAPRRPTPQTAE